MCPFSINLITKKAKLVNFVTLQNQPSHYKAPNIKLPAVKELKCDVTRMRQLSEWPNQ